MYGDFPGGGGGGGGGGGDFFSRGNLPLFQINRKQTLLFLLHDVSNNSYSSLGTWRGHEEWT